MASSYVREDLRCGICSSACPLPLSLPCGDTFCRDCITREQDRQAVSGCHRCPQCEAEFDGRPLMLHKKRRMLKKETVSCTYCDDPVPAEKSCLHCDASLCAKHLKKHTTAKEHVLIEPTAHLKQRKCERHRLVLEYYCIESEKFMCFHCYKTRDSKKHEVVRLNINSIEKTKADLNLSLIRPLRREQQSIETQLVSLKTKQEEREDEASESIACQIGDLKNELDVLQEKIKKTFFKHVSHQTSERKRKLEEEKEDLAKDIDCIKRLRCISDPLDLQKRVLDIDLIKIFKVRKNEVDCAEDKKLISQALHGELLKFSGGLLNRLLKDDFPKMKKSPITLDVKTAHCNIAVSDDLRSAFCSRNQETSDMGPERFVSVHVLSEDSFSSGNHYWEVEVLGTQCRIGVAYGTMERKTMRRDMLIGYDTKSWSLSVNDHLSVWHNKIETKISTDSPVRSFGIFLECEGGRLSFYQLCNPNKHLHTFNTTFTEPLHAAFYLKRKSTITILQ